MRALIQTLVPQAALGWSASPPARRAAFVVALSIGEALLASVLFEFPVALRYWQNPVFYAHTLAKLLLLSGVLLVLVSWPRRQEIIEAHRAAAAGHDWRTWLFVNAALFTSMLLAKFAFSHAAAPPSYTSLLAYCGLPLATLASLAFAAAPPAFWRRLLKLAPVEIAVAATGAAFVYATSRLAEQSWSYLAGATLSLSHWFLTLYEPHVFLDTAQRTLEVNGFRVQVFASCSGYEGVGLIVAFLAIYMWVFRRELRFPHVLLLFPLGITAVWVLNGLRIAALVSIGAHASPEIAVQGFHSQGGWIGFLLVTLGLIAASRKIPSLVARPVTAPKPAAAARDKSGAELTLEFLAPFMALMAASVLASAFAPHDQWLYAVKVAAVGAVLWWFRAAYVPLLSGASLVSIAAGLAVGVAWIATDPDKGVEMPLGIWLASLPAWLAVVWLALRAFGSVLLVPVAEELAFRGYLHRVLISARFERVGTGEYRLLAFIGSSLAFGLMHQRWLAAFLAGAVYALLMYRTKRLSDPIAAHISSNAVIMLWAVAAGQWSLL